MNNALPRWFYFWHLTFQNYHSFSFFPFAVLYLLLFSMPFLRCAQFCHLLSGLWLLLVTPFCILSVPLEGTHTYFSVFNTLSMSFILTNQKIHKPFPSCCCESRWQFANSMWSASSSSKSVRKDPSSLFHKLPPVSAQKFLVKFCSYLMITKLSLVLFHCFFHVLSFHYHKLKLFVYETHRLLQLIESFADPLYLLCPHWLFCLHKTVNGLWSTVQSFLWAHFHLIGGCLGVR